jgi:hypothetical protein
MGSWQRPTQKTGQQLEEAEAVKDSLAAYLAHQRSTWVYTYFTIGDVIKARSCHWDPVTNRIKSAKENMLAELEKWDP